MTPHYANGRTDLYVGDCRDVLAQLEPGSVQCAVTSPPYWSLRDYGLEPTIWGGASDCAHEWSDPLISKSNDSNRGTMEWTTGGDPTAKVKGERVSQGAFCRHCGAWRGTLGLEPTVDLYVAHMVTVFALVWRVLADDGTLWLNMGDSYASGPTGIHNTLRDAKDMQNNSGWTKREQPTMNILGNDLKPKDLIGMPWRVAFALQASGWYLRSDIIWAKPNPMPESVTDRPTRSHEYVFLMTKSARYHYDADAIREPSTSLITKMPDGWDTSQGTHGSIHPNGRQKGRKAGPNAMRGQRALRERGSGDLNEQSYHSAGRNKRSVWTIATQPFPDAHFATFPEKLVEPCVLAGSTQGSTVLDPFAGSGTVGVVAQRFGRRSILIEQSTEYADIAVRRIGRETLPMFT